MLVKSAKFSAGNEFVTSFHSSCHEFVTNRVGIRNSDGSEHKSEYIIVYMDTLSEILMARPGKKCAGTRLARLERSVPARDLLREIRRSFY